MNIKDFYDKVGGDYVDVLSRLNNEAMVIRFLGKFVQDNNMELLRQAIGAGDNDAAFRAAHSIKGICMNLGLTNLQKSAGELTENLRKGNESEDTSRLFKRAYKDYMYIVKVIQKLQFSNNS